MWWKFRSRCILGGRKGGRKYGIPFCPCWFKMHTSSDVKWAFQVPLVVKNLAASAGEMWDLGSIALLRRSSLHVMATHSSILAWRIPMDREAWRATVHGVTKSRTGLKWLSTHPVLSHPESPQGALLGWLQRLRAWEWAAFLSSSRVSSRLTLGAVVVADGLTATASFVCWYGRLHFFCQSFRCYFLTLSVTFLPTPIS